MINALQVYQLLQLVFFFQLPPVGGKPVYVNYKNNTQNFNSLWKLFKIFELTEVLN